MTKAVAPVPGKPCSAQALEQYGITIEGGIRQLLQDSGLMEHNAKALGPYDCVLKKSILFDAKIFSIRQRANASKFIQKHLDKQKAKS